MSLCYFIVQQITVAPSDVAKALWKCSNNLQERIILFDILDDGDLSTRKRYEDTLTEKLLITNPPATSLSSRTVWEILNEHFVHQILPILQSLAFK